ncbi:MAG: 50S ribosome-binding GTPase, partial [Candidatus Lokiarchaeota archaeon]|nr:50S ribosome-binding GTPase [Candidatus Lokiarchaeota archaeon]
MSEEETKSVVIKDFFKRSVIISELDEALKFKPDTLIGIDKISSEKLIDNNVNNIEELAHLSLESLPSIKEIPNKVLTKWVKIAQVLEKAIKEKTRTHKKLLMIGLDNGGKTSILAVLQDKFSIIKSLLPTRGVKREKLDFFGYPILSWDLGGQVQYREKLYFNRPELFFTEADLILYVIDTQDSDRFAETANYFRQVLKVLKDLDEFPPILVVLSKSDQDIRTSLEWQNNVSAIKNKFNNIVKEHEKTTISYSDTTIYQRETIMQMFSEALKLVSETSEIIENILEDFTSTIEGKASSLISMDGLIFGTYTSSDIDEALLNNTALIMLTLSNFHNSIGLTREPSMSLDFPLNGFTIRGEKLFEYSELKIPVYLWLLSENVDLLYEKIDYFKQQLLPL